MAKLEKAKSGKSRNDDRKNGKAPKKPDRRRHSQNPQSDLQLVLLGKGLYRVVSDRVGKDKARVGEHRRSNNSED